MSNLIQSLRVGKKFTFYMIENAGEEIGDKGISR